MAGTSTRQLLYVSWIASTLLGTASASIWHVSIDERPAPLPEDGPPFSANASRDRSLLPAQICGIVGAYLCSIFIVGSLLLTVAKRMRSAAQSSQSTLAVEMVKPSSRTFEPSPVSPEADQRAWYSPKRLRRRSSAPNSVRSASSPNSPGLDSVASFDAKVIEADKLSRQQEMERLYAAVMARDETLEKPLPQVTEVDVAEVSNRHIERQPPRLLTSAPHLQHLQDPTQRSPVSPVTPRSPIRAIYPPDSPLPTSPTSPTSPVRAEIAPQRHRLQAAASRSSAHLEHPGPSNRVSKASSLDSGESSSGKPKKLRRSLRRIKISPPIQVYPGEESSDSARTPLTPRYYTDPGIPPDPPSPLRSDAPSAPSTPATFESSRRRSRREDSNLNHVRDLPLPAPQRLTTAGDQGERQQEEDLIRAFTSKRTSPPNDYMVPEPYRAPTANTSVGTLGSLPFRTMRSAHADQVLRSPALNTKTTYLERRRDMLTMGGQKTGMATPYSPYMPFTPITPVTPRLTSRAERRQKQRDEGRRVLGQEDAVIDEKDMWGSSY